MASGMASVEHRAKLLKAKTTLAERNPFLGHLALSLPIRVVADDQCLTACVNAHGQCFFGESFLNQLSLAEVVMVILHETLHLALDCFQRQEERHPRLWNLAHDLAVNGLIRESHGCNQYWAWPEAFPPLWEEPLGALAAEAIYDLLWETFQQEAVEAGVPSLIFGPSNHHSDPSREDRWTPEQREAARRVIQSQSTWVIDLDASGWDAMDTETRERLRFRWQQALLGAAEQTLGSEGMGSMPAWAQRLLGPLIMPKLPWFTLLARKVHGHLRGGRRSFSRPGRRSLAAGALLPGRVGHLGVVGVFVDVSGSVGDAELALFFSELKGILEQTGHRVRLMAWDTEVRLDLLLEDAEDLRASLLEGRETMLGGGGTDPSCVIRHLQFNEGENLPSFAVLLTDGYVPWPAAEEWPLDLLVVTTEEFPEPHLHYDALTLELPYD